MCRPIGDQSCLAKGSPMLGLTHYKKFPNFSVFQSQGIFRRRGGDVIQNSGRKGRGVDQIHMQHVGISD